jgi:protein-tyrosine phosphatase
MNDEVHSRTVSVLFVCLGNICRSPLAEGVFRAEAGLRGLEQSFSFDSAGTGGWHAGDPPDPRSVAECARHGVDISRLGARQISRQDIVQFTHIFGMDRNNVADIRRMGTGPAHIGLFMQACAGENRDVPDPYYGTAQDFAAVYRMVRSAAVSWFDAMEARLKA